MIHLGSPNKLRSKLECFIEMDVTSLCGYTGACLQSTDQLAVLGGSELRIKLGLFSASDHTPTVV